MKKTLLAFLLLSACGSDTRPKNQWARPPYIIHADIIVDKYNHDQCVNNGGTWVIADNFDYLNAFVGCIEKASTEVTQ